MWFDFEPIREQLLNAPTTTSTVDVFSALIAEETRLSSHSPLVSVPHNILAASQTVTKVKGSSSEPFEHCKKTSNHE